MLSFASGLRLSLPRWGSVISIYWVFGSLIHIPAGFHLVWGLQDYFLIFGDQATPGGEMD